MWIDRGGVRPSATCVIVARIESRKLSKTDEGTKLVLICTGTESFPQDIPEFTRESGKAGWEYFIQQSLLSFLNRA